GYKLRSDNFFDTLCVDLGSQHSTALVHRAEAHHLNLRIIDAKTVGVTLDETTSEEDLQNLLHTFGTGGTLKFKIEELTIEEEEHGLGRTSGFLAHPVFNRYH